MPLPSPPAAPSSGETAARPVERRLTVGAATAIAVTALIVFGAGVAIGKLAFPTSTDRSPGRLSAASRHRTGTADLVERVDDAAGHLHGSVAGRAACDVSAAPRHHSGAADLVERVDDAAGHLHGSVAGRAACDVSAAPRHHSGAVILVERVDAAAASSEAEALDDTASHQDGDVEHRRPDTERRLRLFRWEVPVSGTGRRILDFTLLTTCSGPVTLPPIQVAASGTFAFSGKPPGASPGTTVHVTGRFDSPAAVRGTTRVTRGTCRSPESPFAAHLS